MVVGLLRITASGAAWGILAGILVDLDTNREMAVVEFGDETRADRSIPSS
jgi:hypothetical protein